MSWFLAAVLATILFSVYPVFGNKAGQIHGENMNFVIDGLLMFIGCIILSVIHRQDFQRITVASLGYAMIMGLSSVGFLLMLYAWRIAPDKLSVIQITIGFSTVITAIIGSFVGSKMDFHQWVGAVIAFAGIALVNIDKSTINQVIKFLIP